MAKCQFAKESEHPSSSDLALERTSSKRYESARPIPVTAARKKKDKSNCTPPLMLQVCQGDRKAFESLCHKYTLPVGAYFRRHIQCVATVDDLTQEVFDRVWHKREYYRSGTADLPYLRGFAVYVLKNYQQRYARELTVRPDYDLRSIIDDIHASPLDQTDLLEQIQILRDLVAELPDRQQQVLELTYYKCLSSKEASEKLGCSAKTVRSNRCRGLTQLKAWLQKDD